MSKKYQEKKLFLPQIENKLGKQAETEGDNYNFVNHGKRKTKDFSEDDSNVQELLLKIDELKKEVDQRNTAILGLQRNFESLSILLKNEKNEAYRTKLDLQSARDQLQAMQEQYQESQKKQAEDQQRQRAQKLDAEALAEEKRVSAQLRQENQAIKQAVQQLEKALETKILLIRDLEIQNKDLAAKAAKIDPLEREKKRLKDDISHLQDEILCGTAEQERLQKIILGQKQQLTDAQEQKEKINAEFQELKRIRQDQTLGEQELHQEIARLQNESQNLREQLRKLQEQKESSQALQQMQNERENNSRLEISDLRNQVKELQKVSAQLREQLHAKDAELSQCRCGKYSFLIDKYNAMREAAATQSVLSSSQKEQSQEDPVELVYRQEQRSQAEQLLQLRESINALSSELSSTRSSLQTHTSLCTNLQQRLSEQETQVRQLLEEKLRLMSSLHSEFNAKEQLELQQSETQKSLQAQLFQVQNELRSSQQQLLSGQSDLRAAEKQIQGLHAQLSDLQDQLKAREEDLLNVRTQADSSEAQLGQTGAELRGLQRRLQDQLDQQRQLGQAHEQAVQAMAERQETEKRQREELQLRLEELSRQREEEIAQMERACQTLAERDKTIAEMKKTANNDLLQREKLLEETKQKGALALAARERDLAERDKEIAKLNSKIAGEIAETLTQLHDQVSAFERDAVVKKKEEQAKDNEIYKLKLDLKSMTTKVQNLENTITQLDPEKVRKQIKENESKETVLRNSIAKIQNAQEACISHLSCSLCLEVIKSAYTCAPCGHSYCEKCTKGYQPNCAECKKEGSALVVFKNKILDGVISKVNYIKLTIDSLK